MAIFLAALLLATTTACPFSNLALKYDDAGNSPEALDMARARQLRPSDESHVHGETALEAYRKMNDHLEASAVTTSTCNSFELEQLNELARGLYALRTPEYNEVYAAEDDRRTLHFDAFDYKEQLFVKELTEGTKDLNTTRGGKCAELVMWFVHHLSATQRARLAGLEDFVLPLMPMDVAHRSLQEDEYERQIGCTSCHVAVPDNSGLPLGELPIKEPGPQYPTNCPADEATGLPLVWYEEEQSVAGGRVKRCDWDYEPFCEPCEGRGGMIWGPNKEDWSPMPCTPVATPDEVPAENRTSPLWPRSFVVEEYASLTFPGRDPCIVGFDNSTYKLYYSDPVGGDGPLYHSVGHTGPSGPSPVPGSSWAYSNGNFYNSVDVNESPVFCLCLGTEDPVGEGGIANALTGPLYFDFNNNARYIGREEILPEYSVEIYGFEKYIIADHYAKGPHHFWMEVSTGYMVREWQPFNGLQTYYDWEIRVPTDEEIEIPSICKGGFLFQNISCINPDPTA